jgi:hypothetical protein
MFCLCIAFYLFKLIFSIIKDKSHTSKVITPNVVLCKNVANDSGTTTKEERTENMILGEGILSSISSIVQFFLHDEQR